MIADVQQFFAVGMKRTLPQLPQPPDGHQLDLGCGKNPVPGAFGLDYPLWDGSKDPIPRPDDSVAAVYAMHFLEHLTGEQAIKMLREIERVLKPGGVLYICVPHRMAALAYEDLDHKSYWSEETLRVLFRNDYYTKHRNRPWRLDVVFNMIGGVNERNIAVFMALVKTKESIEPHGY
jgi:ubiquinone/menaquinone biosynthesis C-methylase UbiE